MLTATLRASRFTAFAIAAACAAPAISAQSGLNNTTSRGSTASSLPAALDSEAMNRMLKADRDKDGTLSREELEQYDLTLARRFKEVDSDGDGRLTLHEFEKLITSEPLRR